MQIGIDHGNPGDDRTAYSFCGVPILPATELEIARFRRFGKRHAVRTDDGAEIVFYEYRGAYFIGDMKGPYPDEKA